jgi:hypothetical protein
MFLSYLVINIGMWLKYASTKGSVMAQVRMHGFGALKRVVNGCLQTKMM